MIQSRSNIVTFILIGGLLSLVSLGFGMGGMASHGDSSMNGCPFATAQTSMCPMTVNSHVSHWLSNLIAVARSQVPLLLLAILLVVATSRNVIIQIFSQPKQRVFRRLLSEHNPLGKIFSNFPELFSSGILHPKIFSAVTS